MRLSPFKDRRSRAGLQSDRCAGRPKGLKENSESAGATTGKLRQGAAGKVQRFAGAGSFGNGNGAIGGATGALAVGLSWFSASHSIALWTRV